MGRGGEGEKDREEKQEEEGAIEKNGNRLKVHKIEIFLPSILKFVLFNC